MSYSIVTNLFSSVQKDKLAFSKSIKRGIISSMTKADLIIIGGGASGMMAAIVASRLKKSVVLVEKNTELGRKILATGSGRCNLTNRFTVPERYHGADQNFISTILKKFDQFAAISFFENLGIVLKEENLGRIFPITDEAKTIVNALIFELEKNHVKILLNDQARRIEKDNNSFLVTLQSGQIIETTKIVMATGGQASPHLGTSGDAYYWLKNFGHNITPLYPALVPLEIKESWIKDLQGLKIEAKLFTTVGGKLAYEKTGDVLFTHFGLSGPAAMAQAGAIENNMDKDVKIHLDLFPEETTKSLDEKIAKIIETNGAKQIKNSLAGIISSNLAPAILSLLKIDPDKKSAEISKLDRIKISQILKNIELTISGIRPFKEAQVTHGGVDVDEFNPQTLESKKVPGLFVTGELLNVDGDSGGFNLQWAWSTGFIAGTNID